MARHGIACPTIAGAGTGSFEFEQASGVYTELQCGSYIFLDADYGRDLDRDAKAVEPSLFVWPTVTSRPTDDRAIVDAGLLRVEIPLQLLLSGSRPPKSEDRPTEPVLGRGCPGSLTNPMR